MLVAALFIKPEVKTSITKDLSKVTGTNPTPLQIFRSGSHAMTNGKDIIDIAAKMEQTYNHMPASIKVTL